jgi:hypothetical protein
VPLRLVHAGGVAAIQRGGAGQAVERDGDAEGLGVLVSEMAVLRRILDACCRGPVRLFRNNVGALEDKTGRIVRYGLCKGSSDLIGWHTVEITPDMVGQRVAVFVALEVKDKGRLTQEQATFLEVVRRAGGIAAEVRSVDDAEAALRR